MKNNPVNPLIVIIAIILFASISISTLAFGQDNYSVSGEITYWWKEGQIVVWLITKEERDIDKKLLPQKRTLKIELDSQSTQEVQDKKVDAETVSFKFVDVPKGTYGIICILDKNKNGELDYPEGFEPGTIPPLELYAFSRPKSWGRGSFDDFKFDVNKDVSGLKIELR